jgi:hypothetical protein
LQGNRTTYSDADVNPSNRSGNLIFIQPRW